MATIASLALAISLLWATSSCAQRSSRTSELPPSPGIYGTVPRLHRSRPYSHDVHGTSNQHVAHGAIGLNVAIIFAVCRLFAQSQPRAGRTLGEFERDARSARRTLAGEYNGRVSSTFPALDAFARSAAAETSAACEEIDRLTSHDRDYVMSGGGIMGSIVNSALKDVLKSATEVATSAIGQVQGAADKSANAATDKAKAVAEKSARAANALAEKAAKRAEDDAEKQMEMRIAKLRDLNASRGVHAPAASPEAAAPASASRKPTDPVLRGFPEASVKPSGAAPPIADASTTVAADPASVDGVIRELQTSVSAFAKSCSASAMNVHDEAASAACSGTAWRLAQLSEKIARLTAAMEAARAHPL
jgi:hypothetical protein